jgi:hypothetical protein
MKDAFIICTSVLVGIGLIYLVIAILPFLIAMTFIGLIYWMIAKFLVGGFSPWQRK